MVGAPFGNIDQLDFDGGFGAGCGACVRPLLLQPAEAHVALADYTAVGVILRHAVWAVPRTVAASYARAGAVQHQAGGGVFGICVDGTALQARRFQTVVATHGKVEPLCERVRSALDLADAAPIHVERIAVLLGAGHFAAPASNALRHVEVEPVLLPRARPDYSFALLCSIEQQ